MSNKRFASVWDAIEDNPEEAENMKLRSVLLMVLKNHMAKLIESGHLVVDPKPRPRYTLAELLAEAETAGAYLLPVEEREWIDAPAVGKEL